MRRLIRTDGSYIDFTQNVPMERVADLIGAAMLDTVILWHIGRPLHVMYVDDLGYDTVTIDNGNGHFENVCTQARKPVNQEATRLYHANCAPGTTHQIVGDVLVVPDDDYGI